MITFKAKEASGEIINSALTPFLFPAGEAHTKREERRDLEPVEIAILQPETGTINDDLFQLAMWVRTIDDSTSGSTKKVAVLPYVPAARMDRGVPFGLDVYTTFLNGLNIDQTIIFDPHSQVAPQLLKPDLSVVYPEDFFAQKNMLGELGKYDGIIAPDKGAVDRATSVASLTNIPIYMAEKTRDFATGKLTGFKLDGLPLDGTYLIVDDICDGGGTFLGLAAELGLPREQLDLYVSHGVFSGLSRENLPKSFGKVHTTNSYGPRAKLNYGDWRTGTKGTTFIKHDVIRLLMSKIKY
jgi:ribose-phosphate pyrophosphokinase